jgi:hypothetical protein
MLRIDARLVMVSIASVEAGQRYRQPPRSARQVVVQVSDATNGESNQSSQGEASRGVFLRRGLAIPDESFHFAGQNLPNNSV